MNKFRTDLIIKRDMSKDYCWILYEPLVYENDKYLITVKVGFDFDFASIPWFFRRLLPKNGRSYDRAACIHDALYASNALPKDVCDRLLHEASIADGTQKAIADGMYQAVKIGGASSYAYDDIEELNKYKALIEVVEK